MKKGYKQTFLDDGCVYYLDDIDIFTFMNIYVIKLSIYTN